MSSTTSPARPLDSMTRKEVIAEFLPAYERACQRLKEHHGDNYRSHLEGEVSGIEGPRAERALSWLHIEVKQAEHAERIKRALEDGWIDAEDLSAKERTQRHPLVVLAGRGKDCTHPSRSYGVAPDSATEWIEIPDALIRFDPAHNTPTTVVPRGSRVNGTKVVPLRVLVKRATVQPEPLDLFTATS